MKPLFAMKRLVTKFSSVQIFIVMSTRESKFVVMDALVQQSIVLRENSRAIIERCQELRLMAIETRMMVLLARREANRAQRHAAKPHSKSMLTIVAMREGFSETVFPNPTYDANQRRRFRFAF